jgi:hypothetical protein
MANDREIAARGEIARDEVEGRHTDGFERALDRALSELDGSKYAGQELFIRAAVVISSNPGGVGQYRVELVPRG